MDSVRLLNFYNLFRVVHSLQPLLIFHRSFFSRIQYSILHTKSYIGMAFPHAEFAEEEIDDNLCGAAAQA